MIVNPDGYILTNNHVVDGASDVQVTLSDKRNFKAKVVGTDPRSDLAVLKIGASSLASVTLGDSTKAESGRHRAGDRRSLRHRRNRDHGHRQRHRAAGAWASRDRKDMRTSSRPTLRSIPEIPAAHW